MVKLCKIILKGVFCLKVVISFKLSIVQNQREDSEQ